MPRPGRVFFDGAVYHVYNRLARGERVFAEAEAAERFADLLREVTARDGVTVFAWALLPNHVPAGAAWSSRRGVDRGGTGGSPLVEARSGARVGE